MNPFAVLVLPQNDTPENRAKRQAALDEQQGLYRYDYPAIVAGLPMAATPIPVDLSIDWVFGIVEVAVALGENLVDIILPNVVHFDVDIPIHLGGKGDEEPKKAEESPAIREIHELASDAQRMRDFLISTRAELSTRAAAVHQTHASRSFLPAMISDVVQAFAPAKHASAPLEDMESWLRKILREIGEFLGKVAGIYGRASDLQGYAAQFRQLPLPWPAGVYLNDAEFAQLRVAGPNPGLLRRAEQADIDLLGLDDARFAALAGETETITAALQRGALYIVDYADLESLVPGTAPAPKYVFAPRALFFVPQAGRRSLRPIAVQTAQAAGSPVFHPGDGTSWEIAKALVNMADGNYHELISHLGLTHLLTEPFVLATLRQLDAEHPLHALLVPHFEGTLLINYAAQTTLITNGGAVDKLLTGTIESARALSASAVKATRYNASFFPDTLVDRGVADASALPDYPYRDDALALWEAIHAWVTDYVGVYYPTDEDVVSDYELQAWVTELSTDGMIRDIGDAAEGAPASISTAAYLVNLVTQIIFTASVQHAAVNFPQHTIMAFTPAMPLAAYAPFPAAAGEPATQLLDVLPPLQMALLQQAVGVALGGVHHTVLGGYGGQLAVRQVGEALQRFQRALQKIEESIQGANNLGLRTPYSTLLPSMIPQSINI